MKKLLILIVLVFSENLFVYAQNQKTNSFLGWDFEIKKITAKGKTVSVEITSRSNKGNDGPVMVICKIENREFKQEKVHFSSGETKTVKFDIPYDALFKYPVIDPYKASKAITGKTPPSPQVTEKEVIVSVRGGGWGGFGYGLWLFHEKKEKLSFEHRDK